MVSAFLNVCSNPRNLRIERLTDAWKRIPPLVRAYGVVELYAITDVGLNFALVVNPCYTESHDFVGFNHTLDYASLLKLGMLIVDISYR